MKLKPCAWKCGRKTDRICGICLQCCEKRDVDIANGVPYHPYRLDRPISAAKRAAIDKAAISRSAQIPRPFAPGLTQAVGVKVGHSEGSKRHG